MLCKEALHNVQATQTSSSKGPSQSPFSVVGCLRIALPWIGLLPVLQIQEVKRGCWWWISHPVYQLWDSEEETFCLDVPVETETVLHWQCVCIKVQVFKVTSMISGWECIHEFFVCRNFAQPQVSFRENILCLSQQTDSSFSHRQGLQNLHITKC